MGAYTLMEGKIVSGKGVWKREGMGRFHVEAYMYYAASDGEWFVGTDEHDMEAREAAGDMSVKSNVMTPGAATAK
jgi:hypothetical protein